MNRFIQAVTSLDIEQVQRMLKSQPRWRTWSEPDGKNALHYLCGTPLVEKWNVPADELERPDPAKVRVSFAILKLLIKNGLDINSIHRIPDKKCGYFPATTVWYAYTRGRNEKLFRWLLAHGVSRDHCLFAIAWNNDVRAAELFKKHGALKDKRAVAESMFAAIVWNNLKIAKWLLKNGADPEVTDARGNAPLLYAVKKKYPPEVIKLLLKYGADPDKQNPKGESARKLARSYRDKRFSKLIG